MKKLLLFIFIINFSPNLLAQPYWDFQPLKFYSTNTVRDMYYDSVTEKSYIFGTFNLVNGDTTNMLEYDGINYTPMPYAPIWTIYAMVRYHDKLYVGGGAGGSSLLSWDGSSWTVIENDDATIYNLKVHDDKLYVLGNFDTIQGNPYKMVAIWNDITWTTLPGIDSIFTDNWSFSDIAFYKGEIYVCGNFIDWDNPSLRDIMMYDSSNNWQPVGDFMTDGLGGLYKLQIWRDTLYVCGIMSELSGAPGNCIAAWDGDNWHNLQNGLSGDATADATVTDMYVYNDELWACGIFKYINGTYVPDNYSGVAKWDGTQWCTMELEKLGTILGIGNWKSDLFLLGVFYKSFGDTTGPQNVVKWIGEDYTDSCYIYSPTAIDNIDKEELAINLYPNPTTDILNISLQFENIKVKNEKLNIEIVNPIGTIIYNSQIILDKNKIIINIKNINSGYYILKLYNSEFLATKQFIKL